MKSWAKLVTGNFKDFKWKSLKVKNGSIPPDLNGILYKNTAACLTRGEERPGHILDGDGAVLGINFQNQQAQAQYRFVRTTGYKEEQQKQSFSYAGINKLKKGSIFSRIIHAGRIKNTANSNILALENHLLATWEASMPYCLERDSFHTKGTESLEGLHDGEAFSSHFKIDPISQHIYNFCVIMGPKQKVLLFDCTPKGLVMKRNDITIDKYNTLPYHDMCLAGQFIVLFRPPVIMDNFPFLCGQKTLWECASFDANRGLEVLIFDKDSLELKSRQRMDSSFMFYHFSNGYVDENGNIQIELCKYPDFKVWSYQKEISSGNITIPGFNSSLVQFTIDPKTAKVLEEKVVLDLPCEFPCVSSKCVSQQWQNTFVTVNPDKDQTDLAKAIAKVSKTGKERLIYTDKDNQSYFFEPTLVSKKNELEEGWLLSLAFNCQSQKSELHIIDSKCMTMQAILEFEDDIAYSFHGMWI